MNTHDTILTLIDSGTLKHVGGIELVVLLSYIRHADVHGVAWPSSETVAQSIGHTDGSHVRRARARLMQLGLLRKLTRRGWIAPYQVQIPTKFELPPTPPERQPKCRAESAQKKPGGSGAKKAGRNRPMGGIGPVPNRRVSPGRIGANPAPNPPTEAIQEAIQEAIHIRGVPAAAGKPDRRVSAKGMTDAPSGCVRFWTAWPSHHRKADAAKCAAKWSADGLEPRAAEIVAHVEACKRSADWAREGGRFIPAPLVYLNQARYDAPAPPAPTPRQPSRKAAQGDDFAPGDIEAVLEQACPTVEQTPEEAAAEFERITGRKAGRPPQGQEGRTDAA